MIYSKIVGWLVFLAGLILIGWTLFNSYNIFTAQTALPEFFKMSGQAVVSQESGTLDIQKQLQQMIGEQLKGFIPLDAIPKLLNLTIWSILAGLLVFGGAQIAGLGIKLIK